ncbi:MAG TPA: hypothetical protein RMG48_09180 [Myxococcales bacterium LLY-WYZ-16_1]|jgi:hypothetical protein|nr:hypothetical protein [Myxococcales bacterium LLY-WYZ-16_1]
MRRATRTWTLFEPRPEDAGGLPASNPGHTGWNSDGSGKNSANMGRDPCNAERNLRSTGRGQARQPFGRRGNARAARTILARVLGTLVGLAWVCTAPRLVHAEPGGDAEDRAWTPEVLGRSQSTSLGQRSLYARVGSVAGGLLGPQGEMGLAGSSFSFGMRALQLETGLEIQLMTPVDGWYEVLFVQVLSETGFRIPVGSKVSVPIHGLLGGTIMTLRQTAMLATAGFDLGVSIQLGPRIDLDLDLLEFRAVLQDRPVFSLQGGIGITFHSPI